MTAFRWLLLRIVLACHLTVCLAAATDAQLYEVRPMKKALRSRAAQPPATSQPPLGPAVSKSAAIDTQLTVEIFSGKEGVGFHAQQWQQSFGRAGVFARIRAGVPGDKIEIQEKQAGKLRQVFVKGKVDPNGTLTFPGHSFSAAEAPALEEWLAELKAYGGQGNPTAQPLWGLSKVQFDAVFHALARRVEGEPAELTFDEAILRLGLPAEYPFKLSVSAEKVLRAETLRSRPGKLQLKGFTQGTALAMLLSQYGLGFRPARTPAGSLELSCVAVEEGQQIWPVGWDEPAGTSAAKLAPRLYEDAVVALKDQKLLDVLEAIAEKTGAPIRIDFAQVEARGIDLESIVVNLPNRHIAWSMLLSRITNHAFLTPKIRLDESQRPFVWITVLPTGLPSDKQQKPLRNGN